MHTNARLLGLVALVATVGIAVALSANRPSTRTRTHLLPAAFRPAAESALREGACYRLRIMAEDPDLPDSLGSLLGPLPTVCDRMTHQVAVGEAVANLRTFRQALVALSGDSAAADSLPNWVEEHGSSVLNALGAQVCSAAINPASDSSRHARYHVLMTGTWSGGELPDSLRVTRLDHLAAPILVFCDSVLGSAPTKTCGPYCCSGPTMVTWTRSSYRFRLVRYPEQALVAEGTVNDEVCPGSLGASAESTSTRDYNAAGRWITRELSRMRPYGR